MARNKISDLNDHLFDTLERLKSGEMELDRAQAICDVGRTIIESGKVELKAIEMFGLSKGTTSLLNAPTHEDQQRMLPPATDPVITYRCRTEECEWTGKQTEKQLIKNGEERRRVCPTCKKDNFTMLVNGVPEEE